MMLRCAIALSLIASAACAQPAPRPTVALESPLAKKLASMAAQRTIVVAHRGDSGAKPENTLPAFESAVAAGADMVELDFHETRDGVLVCIHDDTLDRTTDSVRQRGEEKLRVADFTLRELQKLDAGAWKDEAFAGTRIPTLEDALRAIQPRSITMIEHKHGSAKALVALLRRMKLVDAVLVQSFDWKWLADLHRLEPRLTLAALGGTKKQPHPTAELLEEIARTGAVMVHWNHKRLRSEDQRALRELGYLICVYTADEPADYDLLIELGVDAITTNQPARLLKHLAPPDDARRDR